MDETQFYSKEKCLKDLKTSLEEYEKQGDWEWIGEIAKEIQNLAEIDTPYVVVEDCPMSGSGIWIKPVKSKCIILELYTDETYMLNGEQVDHNNDLPVRYAVRDGVDGEDLEIFDDKQEAIDFIMNDPRVVENSEEKD